MTEREAAALGETDGQDFSISDPEEALRRREAAAAAQDERVGANSLEYLGTVGGVRQFRQHPAQPADWPPPLRRAYLFAFKDVRHPDFKEWVANQIEEARRALERRKRHDAQEPCLFLLVEESGEYSSSQTDIAGTRRSEKDARSWRGAAENCSVWALWPEDADDLLQLDFEAELLREIDGARPEVRPFLEERLALLRARLAQLESAK